MLRLNDVIYRNHPEYTNSEELQVVKATNRYAFLSDGTKITVNNNDRGKFWEVPKRVNQEYIYTKENMASNNTQSVKRGFWKRVSEFDAVKFFSSPRVVLLFALALLLGQSFHSFHTLFLLADSMSPSANWIFSIITALFLDGVLLFHIARGNKFYSFMAFLTCFLLNIYSYHIDTEYWGYDSFFSFVPAMAIPFFLHSIGVTMREDSEKEKA